MVNQHNYQICSNCIMDTSDTNITFDEKGICDYCNNYYNNILPHWQPDKDKKEELNKIVDEIKRYGKNKKYDCIIGASGGIDSSYLLYFTKSVIGLRPLAFSVDTGWNTELANKNLEKITKSLDIDLHVEVVNWEEIRDLQISFLKSQTPYLDFPQDHAIFAGLYNFAVKNNFKYVLTGANYLTEGIVPPYEWVYINDLSLLKDIHDKFGERKLQSFPLCSMLRYRLYYNYFKGMKIIQPLNMIDYNKERAVKELESKFGWENYGTKHYENIFTRFVESYYMVKKFGYDKRRVYLSNLILTNQISRQEALSIIEKPPLDEETISCDIEYITKKLGITKSELNTYINGENKSFRDYKNSFWLLRSAIKLASLVGIEKRMFR